MKRVVHVLGPSQGGIRRHVRYVAQHPPPGWETAAVVGPKDLATYFEDAGLTFRTRRPGKGADLIHAHGLTVGARVLRPHRRPVVITLHMDVDTQGRTARWAPLRALAPLIAARADALIAVSERIGRRFPSATVIAPATEPLGKPLRRRASVRKELETPQDAFVALCVARLHPDKGLDAFVDAVARAGCIGWLAGDGPLRGTLETAAAEAGVRVLGYRDDVADLLGASDVFALPSVGEGYGIAVSEAVTAGLPVVATRSGAVPEIVGEAGVLVPPGDRSAFGDALLSLMKDDAMRQRLRDAANARRLPGPQELVRALGVVYDGVVR